VLDRPVSNLEFERERKSERTLRLDLDCLAVIIIVYVDHYERRFDRLRWVCSQEYTSCYNLFDHIQNERNPKKDILDEYHSK